MAKKKNRSGYCRHMASMIGAIARERGASVEQRTLAVLSRDLDERFGALPEWILNVRPATAKEQSEGKDIVIETTVGRFFIQVKSSAAYADRFASKARSTRIIVVVAAPLEDGPLRALIVSALRQQYDAIMAQRWRTRPELDAEPDRESAA
jgi:hypothetical protein